MRAARTGVVSLCLLLGACTSSTARQAPPPPSSAAPTTTIPGVQASGSRTVLSPIGLRVRASPDGAAKVLGTAAQGVVLTVLGYTAVSGGWYQVKGQTVTGWISARSTLSAPGEFQAYSSGSFNALYPATWSPSQPSPASVQFRSGSNSDDIVVTSSASVAKLPHGRSGYGRVQTNQVVVCGVTSVLDVFQSVVSQATPPYLAELRIPVDPHHALGFYADLSDLGAPLDLFHSFLASVTFSSKQCLG